MNCKNPYIHKNGQAYGCSQCLPCRLNRRRTWTHRLLLEAAQHETNVFATLTYTTPPEDNSLDPKHTQLWLKRLRKSTDRPIRYFLVGEYGEQTQRPHYHAALFNYPNCHWGQSRYSKSRNNCCPPCDLIRSTWGHGHIFLGTLEPSSAAYISGYVTKKMTFADDPRLGDRYPEYARMSLKPGIGGDAVWEIASLHLEYNLHEQQGDVITSLRHGNKIMPLGRYLTRRLRKYVGLPENAPEKTLAKMEAKVLPMRLRAEEITEAPHLKQFKKNIFKNLIIDANAAKHAQIEGRYKLYKKKGNQ